MEHGKKMLPPKLLHGGDYNPDQWLAYPEVLEEDVELMKKANVNCVTLGVFSWSRLEPEEGKYDFGWLSDVIDRLYARGIYTILATPTGAMPHWLTSKYEEVRKVEPNGLRRLHGQRHNFCPSSPVMRQKTAQIDGALSKEFGRHPGVIAWHLSNEYGGDGRTTDCHCPYCQEAFREWLKQRYQTLDALNHAWWTAFWSNIYTDWEQVHSPSELGEYTMHGLKLDWRRFSSDRMLDFCKAEVAAVREGSDLPVLTNMMGAFKPLNYFKWARELDVVSLDNYPFWHFQESDVDMAVAAAFSHTLTRSLKKQPYLLMESAPSMVNWMPRNTLKRPGMHELSSLQAIACGSNSVQYFQWRKSRGSSEKYHGAVVDHKNGGDTRVFRDVSHLGERLQAISEKVMKTCNRPKVALVFDWENWWAADDAQAVTIPFDYRKRWMDYYKVFWEMGIDVDIIDMEDDLSDYRLVVAPVNYMYRGDYIENVKRFVERGGTYVTTYWSGEVDDSDLCFLESHPLRELLGIRTEEIDIRPAHMKNTVSYGGNRFEIKDLCALVHAEGAKVLSVYENDFYAGYPALTRNKYGEGRAYFIASENEIEFLRAFYKDLVEETKTGCGFSTEFPYGVTVSERKALDADGSLWFVQNFNAYDVEIELRETYRDVETGEVLSGKQMLSIYQCLILEKA